MNEVKKMFESWRKFLNAEQLSEVLTDKTLKSDTTNANTFIEFFVRSPETAAIALEMIRSSISDYRDLMKLGIDSVEYREKANRILRDPNAVADDEMIESYIDELEKIEDQLKSRYNLS